ncbi:MAG TPA: hypothetical protein VF940_26135 [Streptosporangiaceae bacterium]
MMDVSAAVGSGRAHVAGGPASLGLPAAHDVLGGFNAVAPGCVAAQRVEADTGRPDAGAIPVEHRGQVFVEELHNRRGPFSAARSPPAPGSTKQ